MHASARAERKVGMGRARGVRLLARALWLAWRLRWLRGFGRRRRRRLLCIGCTRRFEQSERDYDGRAQQFLAARIVQLTTLAARLHDQMVAVGVRSERDARRFGRADVAETLLELSREVRLRAAFGRNLHRNRSVRGERGQRKPEAEAC